MYIYLGLVLLPVVVAAPIVLGPQHKAADPLVETHWKTPTNWMLSSLAYMFVSFSFCRVLINFLFPGRLCAQGPRRFVLVDVLF